MPKVSSSIVSVAEFSGKRVEHQDDFLELGKTGSLTSCTTLKQRCQARKNSGTIRKLSPVLSNTKPTLIKGSSFQYQIKMEHE